MRLNVIAGDSKPRASILALESIVGHVSIRYNTINAQTRKTLSTVTARHRASSNTFACKQMSKTFFTAKLVYSNECLNVSRMSASEAILIEEGGDGEKAIVLVQS